MRGYPDINKLHETLKQHNLILKDNFTSYTTELNKELVKEGVGIGWGLKKCVEKDIKEGILESGFDDNKIIAASIFLYFLEN